VLVYLPISKTKVKIGWCTENEEAERCVGKREKCVLERKNECQLFAYKI
jgi:hypothetical protein